MESIFRSSSLEIRFNYSLGSVEIAFLYFFNLQNDVDASKRQVTPEEVSSWCQDFHVPSFIETSSKNAVNVTEAFELAVSQWKRRERMSEREMRASGDTIDLTKSIPLDNNSNKSCCFSGNNNRPNPSEYGD